MVITHRSKGALVLLVGLTTMLFMPWLTLAALPPDPYADAVDPATSPQILSRDHALGAPDGKRATVVANERADLILDLGEGEEGTGNLTVYYQVSAAMSAVVEFLDAQQVVIAQQVLHFTPDGTTVTIPYAHTPAPYRYIRLQPSTQRYQIDAVATATYRPDSDGDSLPDTWELQYGLNPLDPTGDHGADGDPDGDGVTNAQEYAAGRNPVAIDTQTVFLPLIVN